MEKRDHFKKRITILLIATFITWGSIIIISGKKDEKEKGEHYKLLKKLALKHGDLWEKEIGKKLKVVAGNTLEAGTFAMFAKERPQVLPFNNLGFATYLTKEVLFSEGYILLQRCGANEDCNTSNLGEVKEVYLTQIKRGKFYLQVIYVKPLLHP
jgi:hypothetical protein